MPEPKYRQIANELRAAIHAGHYEPGDRLPGENDLMATYGVARMTARQALGVLTTEGVADARKGSGVYVRDFTPIIRSALTRLSHDRWSAGASIWSAETDGRDLNVATTVIEGPPPERIAPLLALPADELVCIRARRFVLDGKPVLLSTSYLPSSIVAGSRDHPSRTPVPAAATPVSKNSDTRPRTSAKTSGPACPSPTKPKHSTSRPAAAPSSTSSAPPSPKTAAPSRSTR